MSEVIRLKDQNGNEVAEMVLLPMCVRCGMELEFRHFRQEGDWVSMNLWCGTCKKGYEASYNFQSIKDVPL